MLDTNLFFNMEPGLGLGKKTEEVVAQATKAMKKARDPSAGSGQGAEFFMPPRIIEEFLSFFEDQNQTFIQEFLRTATSKSANITSVQFPASIFYKLVEDIRSRSYRGLNIAEEELKKAAQLMLEAQNLDKKEFEIKVGDSVKNLRERYRQATRTGFLDSVADLDLITLSQELGATLVTTDEGVIVWGRAFGVREMAAPVFGSYLKKLLP